MNRELAAIDLGSNSFHLLIVRPDQEGFTEVERLKEKVQLLHGIEDQKLHADAMSRGRRCLRRYAQRLEAIDPDRIVVMGTQALRQASNGREYAADLSAILGVPVQVIEGVREAQLIYNAVDQRTGWLSQRNKIVLDIGGGSTEIAIGDGSTSTHQISVGIGCVSFKDAFFDTQLGIAQQLEVATEYAQAQIAAHMAQEPEFAARLKDYVAAGALSFGTSGTVESIMSVLAANGWIDEVITPDALDELYSALLEDRWVIDAGLPGLAPDRADIFPAGVAILRTSMTTLGLTELRFAGVSLLHGMVYEILPELDLPTSGRRVRQASVNRLATEFGVDPLQAKRVGDTAMILYQQTDSWWVGTDGEYGQLLRWAADLHEIGQHINSKHYHRHGGYVVKHAQLPGFTDLDRNKLAVLIRGHRRSLPEMAFRAFSADHQTFLMRSAALIRIAVILHRSHSDRDPPQVHAEVDQQAILLKLGDGWLERHPLTLAEMGVEIEQLARVGIQLRLMDLGAN
ncbi:MAG: Ppx/GppA phosphatase family protein [Pseudomonadota bacterium]